jgi:hypothetical protein
MLYHMSWHMCTFGIELHGTGADICHCEVIRNTNKLKVSHRQHNYSKFCVFCSPLCALHWLPQLSPPQHTPTPTQRVAAMHVSTLGGYRGLQNSFRILLQPLGHHLHQALGWAKVSPVQRAICNVSWQLPFPSAARQWYVVLTLRHSYPPYPVRTTERTASPADAILKKQNNQRWLISVHSVCRSNNDYKLQVGRMSLRLF